MGNDLRSREISMVAVVVVVVVWCEVLYRAFVLLANRGGVYVIIVCGGVCVSDAKCLFGAVVLCLEGRPPECPSRNGRHGRGDAVQKCGVKARNVEISRNSIKIFASVHIHPRTFPNYMDNVGVVSAT